MPHINKSCRKCVWFHLVVSSADQKNPSHVCLTYLHPTMPPFPPTTPSSFSLSHTHICFAADSAADFNNVRSDGNGFVQRNRPCALRQLFRVAVFAFPNRYWRFVNTTCDMTHDSLPLGDHSYSMAHAHGT